MNVTKNLSLSFNKNIIIKYIEFNKIIQSIKIRFDKF